MSNGFMNPAGPVFAVKAQSVAEEFNPDHLSLPQGPNRIWPESRTFLQLNFYTTNGKDNRLEKSGRMNEAFVISNLNPLKPKVLFFY